MNKEEIKGIIAMLQTTLGDMGAKEADAVVSAVIAFLEAKTEFSSGISYTPPLTKHPLIPGGGGMYV